MIGLRAVLIAAACGWSAPAIADGVPQANQDALTCGGFNAAVQAAMQGQPGAQDALGQTTSPVLPYQIDLISFSTLLGLYDKLTDAEEKDEVSYNQLHATLACALYPGMSFPDAIEAAAMLYQQNTTLPNGQ